MGKLVQEMVGPIRTDSPGSRLRRRTYSSMVYSRRPYWRYISDCVSDGFIALATLDRRTPSVAAWLYSRYSTAGNTDRTYYITTVRATHYRRTSRSTYGGSCRALSIEHLFHLFVCTSFPNSLPVFEHHGCY